MQFLRDRWRRGAVYQYFAELEPIDRATVLIVLALVFSCAFAALAISRLHEPVASSEPRLTAPPFDLQFAVAR